MLNGLEAKTSARGKWQARTLWARQAHVRICPMCGSPEGSRVPSGKETPGVCVVCWHRHGRHIPMIGRLP